MRLGHLKVAMITDENIRTVCVEAARERDAKRLGLMLSVMKSLCKQYLEERAPFLAHSRAPGNGNGAKGTRIVKPGKRAA